MRICIFGASGEKPAKEYFEAAEELGRLLASGGHTMVFGGGKRGLMGACARGARACGGKIIGIAPAFFDEPGVLYSECTEMIYTDTVSQRKQKMEELAEAYIVMPGGIGTFEEFFEVITLKKLGTHNAPIAMLNTDGYYTGMAALLSDAAERGFVSADCMRLFTLCSTPAEALGCVLRGESGGDAVRSVRNYST